MPSTLQASSPAVGRGSRVKLLAISLAALACTVLALEVPALLGWVDYRFTIGLAEHMREPKPYPAHTTITTAHPGDLVTFYGLKDAETRSISFRTDHLGFRNESDLERATVVALGDSFVENAFIPQNELFTTLLARQLGAPVANRSHSGWGPNHELEALRRFAFPLQPRLVLWVLYEGNDLADMLRYGGRDVPWSDRLFLTSTYLRLAALVEAIRFGNTHINYGREGIPPFGSCVVPCSVLPCPRMYFGNLAGPITLYEEVGFQKIFDLLALAAAETHDHGGALVVVYAPVALRVYHDICEFDEDNAARRSTLNDLPNRVQTWARSRGVGFVDLTPALTAAASRGELVYFPDDTHWSAAGNAVVAQALAEAPAIVHALAAPNRNAAVDASDRSGR